MTSKPFSSPETRCLLLLLLALGLYYAWMDLRFFRRVRDLQAFPSTGDPSEPFTPFEQITVKLMMLDPTNHYLLKPGTAYLVRAANLTDTFPSLTPNAVSTAHVVLAVATSRLLIDNADLRRRQLGVILFALRNVLDVLDGTIARESRRHHRLDTYEGFGYYYDGICDAVGIASLMFACVFYLLKLHGAHGAGASEDAVRLIGLSSPVKEKGEFEWTRNGGGPLTKRRIWVLAVCFGGQIIMSTVGWNTVMTGYHEVLEGEDRTPEQKAMALEVAKSWSMWMIAWCWRLANCNMLFDVVLVAIFLNKAIELFQCFQVIGYLVLGPLILLSEFHLAAVKDSMLGLAPHVQ